MARIPMSSGFSILPEGPVVLQIVESTYDENFGKAVVKFQTAEGKKHEERYQLLDGNNQPNDGAMGAYSIMAKNAMNDFDMPDVDPAELVGHYLAAECYHTEVESTKYPGRMNTYAHLKDMAPADGFPGQEAVEEAPVAEAPTGSYDLASLLGD